jgi:hypothetical protein
VLLSRGIFCAPVLVAIVVVIVAAVLIDGFIMIIIVVVVELLYLSRPSAIWHWWDFVCCAILPLGSQ